MDASNKDIGYLASELGYLNDAGYISPDNCPPSLAHVFRQAKNEMGLIGAYGLRPQADGSIIPLVYLSEAANDSEANKIHRLVWNQNRVPFLIVSTPSRFVLYSGFSYPADDSIQQREIAEIAKDANFSLAAFDGLDADSISNGQIWEKWGKQIKLDERVDEALLEELEALSKVLREEHQLPRHLAHTLIGKYIYLHYLRHRNILSDKRFVTWTIDPESVFGRQASKTGFMAVNTKLDDWLNGSVFPLGDDIEGLNQKTIRLTAAVLGGDSAYGQLHLDFSRYDFSHIPIETLSIIYQQFLHAEDRGRKKGAYYTPLPLVDLVMDEVQTRRPLQKGVSVFDPSCGSGAFLVHAYRILIEKEFSKHGKLRPKELRELLTQHIFGVEQDEDACKVAAFSLVLALLDYVTPPDLLRYSEFKLPNLLGHNVLQGDFFDPALPFTAHQFDLIIGNPPWFEPKPNHPEPEHQQAIAWMKQNAKKYPVGSNQIAEAFVWRVGQQLADTGAVGLVMPAMSLFKNQSEKFRQALFTRYDVWCIANFANMASVMFGGRATLPAAVLFFTPPTKANDRNKAVLTYAPFVAHQPILKQSQRRKFKSVWALPVNGGELKQIDYAKVLTGESLTWKVAMWGSSRDERLLKRLQRRFKTFAEFKQTHALAMHQGLKLRQADAPEAIEYVEELIGKNQLIVDKLARQGRVYGFPEVAIEVVDAELAYARKRSGIKKPLSVCQPPHVILSRSRQWAVYCNEFLVVPSPQLGIAGSPGQETLLKALALYLVSDFVRYHQLFYSAEMGIQGSVADKNDIEKLPIPFDPASQDQITKLAGLYDALVACWQQGQIEPLTHWETQIQQLETQANAAVYDLLGLKAYERWLVEDLVHERLRLIKGKLGGATMHFPEKANLEQYAHALRNSLGSFFGEAGANGDSLNVIDPKITIYPGHEHGVIQISLKPQKQDGAAVSIRNTSAELDSELKEISQRLHKQHRHWLYFERGLTLFEGDQAYLFKPMQKLHWLRSQALVDSDNLIADLLMAEPTSA